MRKCEISNRSYRSPSKHFSLHPLADDVFAAIASDGEVIVWLMRLKPF